MLLTPYTSRADIQATSTTDVNFAASGLTNRPIKLAAASGRIASLTALPTAVTLSGGAGTKYLYASLAAPSGSAYSTASGGLLDKILNALPWNRADWRTALQCLLTGDGSLALAAQNSAVTLVATTSATPPDTHHVPLGQAEWDGAAITAITSYESQVDITVSAFIHGQCVLEKSGTDLVLKARDGMSLVIDGTARAVPVAGVSLAPTGLTPGTLYYLYASWSGSAVVLESSTTAPATHTNGVEIKNGDATRTYVGEAWIVTGPAWSPIVPVWSRFHPRLPRLLVNAAGAPYKDVVSTNAETSIFPAAPSLPALPGTDWLLRFTLLGDILNNTGGGAGATLKIKYGGTTILTVGSGFSLFSVSSSATRYLWHARGEIAAAGATNAQIAALRFAVPASGQPGVSGTAVMEGNTSAGADASAAFHNAAAVDATVAQAFDVTIQPTASSASLSIRVFALRVELVPVTA